MKVLLDTDIGSDLDDAVALAYLLAEPDCELLGVTTVSGQPGVRASLASSLCVYAGKGNIPIAPGVGPPLVIDQLQPDVPQAIALSRWRHEEHFDGLTAIDLMRRTIRSHPNELTLIAIGPLTNVALLSILDPEAVLMLKGLVVMGGSFGSSAPPAEWNFRCDPHAARVAYRAPFPSIRTIGLDITRRVVMTPREVRLRFTAPILRPVLDYASVWFEQWDELTFHDPLAVASAFDGLLCRFSRGHIDIDLSTGHEGWSRWSPADDGPHETAVDVDVPRFFDRFFRVIGAAYTDEAAYSSQPVQGSQAFCQTSSEDQPP